MSEIVRLFSFDIDGTLEIGEPPGIIPLRWCGRRAPRLSVGSCSDRPISFQTAMWERLKIAPDFTVLKHRLSDLKARFEAAATITSATRTSTSTSADAGFRFLRADASTHRAWGAELFGEWSG